MTRLYDPAAIRAELGMSDITDINAALTMSGDFAASVLSSDLRTGFDRVEGRVDVFRTDAMFYRGGKPYQTLLLSQGFLTGAPTVSYAGSEHGLETGALTLDPQFWGCNLEKGLLELRDIDLPYVYVKVVYTAGFPSAEGLYTGVPQWLQVLARMQTIAQLFKMYPHYRSSDDTQWDPTTLDVTMAQVLGQRARYFPAALSPLYG